MTVSTIDSDDAFCIKIGILNLFWLDCNQFPKQLNYPELRFGRPYPPRCSYNVAFATVFLGFVKIPHIAWQSEQ